jgi:hypothetical protein
MITSTTQVFAAIAAVTAMKAAAAVQLEFGSTGAATFTTTSPLLHSSCHMAANIVCWMLVRDHEHPAGRTTI